MSEIVLASIPAVRHRAGPAAAEPLNVSSAVITLTPEMEAETLA